MQPFCMDAGKNLEILQRRAEHAPPHTHTFLEFVYVAEGSLEIGIGQNLFHMEEHDFAIVFPGQVHHYQVFDARGCSEICLFASCTLSEPHIQILEESCPEQPVIPHSLLHPDVIYALERLLSDRNLESSPVIEAAYVQIILARCLPHLKLTDRATFESGDIIYQTVSYLAANFRENVTLTGMAKDLGFSQYALSRVFSGTFHMNFNQYLNELRLNYVENLLKYTEQSITDAYENAGFQSQKTFNRAFLKRHGISPREYRQNHQK